MMYKRLKDLKKDKYLIQRDISSMLSISQHGYSHSEPSNNAIPTNMLTRLSNFYGTSIDYILKSSNNKKKN